VSSLRSALRFARYKKGQKGKLVVQTVQGEKLTATLDKGKVKLTDATGASAYVTTTDLEGSNGVVHVIDGVIMPKK
jgi:uncharacterized surface protein with fasciclin (FAS1) repeats